MNSITDTWKLYENGKDLLDRMGLCRKTDEAYRFYEGDHWKGLESSGEKMPIVEIIKPVVDYKTTILTQNQLQAVYTPQNHDADAEARSAAEKVCGKLNSHFLRFWENEAMHTVAYDIVKDAVITGDSYLYFYYCPSGKMKNGSEVDGYVKSEMISNTHIMFGNENETDIQRQPYILVLFRRPVSEVRAEAAKNGIPKSDIRRIAADGLKEHETGFTDEVRTEDGKCMCLMKLWRENGTVHIQKTTKNVIFMKDTDLKLTLYPIAPYVWEPKKGLARGVSDVYKYIPNQIWVNRLEAYRLIATRINAFPKLVYSGDIVNKDDIDAVGVALEVEASDIRKAVEAVGYINPAPMSPDAKAVLDELMSYTKEAAGASDVALGNTRMDNYSAILAIREANAAPLNRQTERLRRFYEDCARILHDFWCASFPNGLTVIGGDGANEVIPTDVLLSMKIDVRVDVTPVSPFSRLTEQQKADNLLTAKLVTLDEYVTLLPDDEPMKVKLASVVAERQARAEQQAEAEMQMPAQAEAENSMMRGGAYTEAAIEAAAAKEEV